MEFRDGDKEISLALPGMELGSFGPCQSFPALVTYEIFFLYKNLVTFRVFCLFLSQETPVSDKRNELHLCFIQRINDLRGSNHTPLFAFRLRSVRWNRTQRASNLHCKQPMWKECANIVHFVRGEMLQGNITEKNFPSFVASNFVSTPYFDYSKVRTVTNLYDFVFHGWTVSDAENYPTFRPTFQLPSSGSMYWLGVYRSLM